MRVELDNGAGFDLGDTETAPTIGITDYSRRVTDAFGVTTVVERGFARRMSVKLGVPFDDVDGLQRRLAELRATAATWVADDRFRWLAFRGFYKDFDVDLAVPPLSACTLTIEGLAASEQLVDAGGDPAPIGETSTLRLLDPITVDDAVLTDSSVAEDDRPAWAAVTTYGLGDKVVRAHRVWESLVGGNVGHDPAGDAERWLDTGPTNRWAAFDQALGTATRGVGTIATTLTAAERVTGLAVLDTEAGSVRVQAPGYDRTRVRTGTGTSFLFLDLDVAASASVTVTIAAAADAPIARTWSDADTWNDGASWADTTPAPTNTVGAAATWSDAAFWDDGATWSDTMPDVGTGEVFAGTILIGRVRSLGITEAAPTAGITDYSVKTVDDFGEVTVTERAWAKRMAARALIRTDALDDVAGRLAAVRARPSLWIGQEGLESLTIYGFPKEWSIEVGETVSKLSLSIEGLSKAAPVRPFAPGVGDVAWPDIKDSAGTKPADNATNGADPTSPFGPGGTVGDAIGAIDEAGRADAALRAAFEQLDEVTLPAIDAAVADANDRIAQARADLEGADAILDQRITALVVEGGGYDDTGLRAEIARVDRVGIAKDKALADQQLTLEASASAASQSLVANDTFNFWPDGQAYPTGWSVWTAGGNFRAERAAGRGGRYSVRTLNDVPEVESGFGQTIRTAGTGKWVIEVTVSGNERGLRGAGVSISGVWSLDFLAEPDIAGRTGDSTTEVRSWTKMIDLDGRDEISVYAMHGYSGFGRGAAAKYMFWHRLGFRPATDGEIKAGRADATLHAPDGVLARQTEITATLADLPNRYAAVQRAAMLEAQVNFGADSGLQRTLAARIEERATAIADAKAGAVASDVQTLRTEYDGTSAEVSRQASVITDKLGTNVAIFRTTVRAGEAYADLTAFADGATGLAGFRFTGPVFFDGAAIFGGTVTGDKLGASSVQQCMVLTLPGAITIPYS